MARPKSIRAPTTASLPSNLRLPSSTPSLVKSFGKLTRQALLDLAFQWLDDRNVQSFPPYLQENEDQKEDEDEGLSPYPAERTINDVRNAYQELQLRKGGKREVIDRILEGDWRHGITLRQLAMVDLRYIDDHPASLRWTALELARIGAQQYPPDSSADMTACLPRLHASTFLNSLQQQIAPLVKAHYYLGRSTSLPLTFLRIFVTNSPYQHPRQAADSLTDASRVIYIAFPDSCPFIYTSIASTTGSKASTTATPHPVATDPRSLQRLVRDAIPKALSLPHQRYTLKATSLTAKSLQALLALRGPGRSNQSNGAFSIFADAALEGSPLDPRPSNTVSPEEHMNQQFHQQKTTEPSEPTDSTDEKKLSKRPNPHTDPREDPHVSKKRSLAVQSRFGTSGSLSSAPLDRLDVRLLDPPTPTSNPASRQTPTQTQTQTTPSLSLTFTGTDIISGIRKLAELGVVDAKRMPSWMTGEEAVSVAVVRQGSRVVKDSG
ncbi:CHL4 family chromosome segregation protein [Aspergillus heteromorphus CBS 117.55]|uniref:CHL4 family chromosome segregation protein n=1 Tax=Aspergillus heteromorphus CBS 117.55 TaxID=1448321 RepID=A0A317WIG1_9EURO|nr:CHL4 family chromosome segregation protein [Aspergillus heteromorphus CBS 117.55]PWY86264.1 CHL4 family chromosome segregation protein [Aspergillus heteromorphus CBS 117.55]